MRLLQVIASTDPSQGGVAEAVVQLSREIVRQGHVVEVATLDAPGRPWQTATELKIHELGPALLRYGLTLRLPYWMRANAHRFDAVLLNGLWNFSSVGARLGLRHCGVPYFVFVHGMLDPWFGKVAPLKHIAKQVYWTVAEGPVLAGAESVIFTAEAERRLASGAFRGHRYRESVCTLGIEGPPADNPSDPDVIRDMFSGTKGREYLLFLGRIHPKKGCDILIDAFARIADRWPDIDLVIAGPDQVGIADMLRERARAAGVEHRIYWPGMLIGSAKWSAIRNSLAFVLPSHQENFGIVVAEAMACGIPVLMTDKVNIWRETVAGGGAIVDEDSVDGMHRTLVAFLSLTITERRRMTVAAFRTYDAVFTVSAATRLLLNNIGDTLAKRRRS